MASEAALKQEIARLTGAINRAKSIPTGQQPQQSTAYPPRSNSYVNPNYRPPSNKYIRPKAPPVPVAPVQPTPRPLPSTSKQDVVIGGVTFESSGRSLVRKDLPKPVPRPPRVKAPRVYKPKTSSRGRRGRPANRNMTLESSRKPYQSVHFDYKAHGPNNSPARSRRKKVRQQLDKPCPRFTTTGACSRGLTCVYQHDPNKIAICWPFLIGNCPNTADNCNLSHDPTPQRTPPCIHFANNGRCNKGEGCSYPHVRVGPRQGVCRDFAVLGFCEKGSDCEQQHVRECPGFAETGACVTKGCKLPHVIRANRTRKPAPAEPVFVVDAEPSADADPQHPSAEDAKLGDEYISLTFNESDDDPEDDVDEDEESGSDESGEEGDDPDFDDDVDINM